MCRVSGAGKNLVWESKQKRIFPVRSVTWSRVCEDRRDEVEKPVSLKTGSSWEVVGIKESTGSA